MDLSNVELLCSILTEDSNVMEWGCGGSTLFFPRLEFNQGHALILKNYKVRGNFFTYCDNDGIT